MSEKKLLSCPFCGGEAKLCSTGNPYEVNYHWIYCKECGCKQPTSIHIEAVINTWNTRVPMQKIVERLEERLEETYKLYAIAFNAEDIGSYDAYIDAINIVKKEGGMNE
jgi:Lar family restriction alleviation protein